MNIWIGSTVLALLSVLTAQPQVAADALPAGEVDALKMNSSEVLLLQVVTVTLISDNDTVVDECMQYFGIEAQIKGVNESMNELSIGDSIEFETYHYGLVEDGCASPPGPAAPALLERGGCGYAFLNPGANETSVPAVYGDSFLELTDGQCLLIIDEVGPDDGLDDDIPGSEGPSGTDSGENVEEENGDTPGGGERDAATTSGGSTKLQRTVDVAIILGSMLVMFF
jgi:hypothetical protein